VRQMEIGTLKQRITLEKRVTAVNDRGFEEKTWQEVATVWAKAENLRGREYYAAAAVQAENTVTFTIRYRPGVDTDLRLLFRGKHYRITAVDNVNYENRFLEIKAREVKTDED